MKTMKNLRMSLEPLQILRQLYPYFLFIKDQQPVRKKKKTASAYSGDEDSEYSDEYSAQSEDSGMTPETHKYLAAAGSLCFVTTENGDQQDTCNLTTMPCGQRTLYLYEMTNNFSNIQAEISKGVDGRTRDVLEQCMTTCEKAGRIKAKKRSRPRREASA